MKQQKQNPVESKPAERTAAVAAVAVKKSKRLTEQQLIAKYPGVVAGTVRWETEGKHANKQTVETKLTCGHVMRLATSDLFQIHTCPACRKASKKTSKPTTQPIAAADAY